MALTLAGVFAYRELPVAALPQVDFPTVSVTAQLPGASPETMANAVATPLIKQFSIIPAIQQISTTNSQGSTSIVIEFDLDRAKLAEMSTEIGLADVIKAGRLIVEGRVRGRIVVKIA